MISDYITSLIRTWIPLAIGYGCSMLLSLGITVTDDQRLSIVGALGTVIAGLYYALVRFLEARWPWTGVLLGKAVVPTYIDESGKHAAPPAVPPQPQSPIDPATPQDRR